MLIWGIWRCHIIDRKPKAKAYSLQWIILFLLCFPLIAMFAYNADQGLRENACTYIGSYFAALIFFTSTTNLFKLKNKMLIFLGTINYSIYPDSSIFADWVTVRSFLSSTFNLASFAIYLFATLACSMTCYFLIEKSGVLLGRRLNSALDRTALKNQTPAHPIPSLALLLAILRFHLEKKLPVAMSLCVSIMFFGSFWRDVSLGSTDQKTLKYSFV